MPRIAKPQTPFKSPVPRPQAQKRALRLRRLAGRCAILAIMLSIAGAYCAGWLDRFDGSIAQRFYTTTAGLGFRITDVALDGREFTSPEDVLAAVGIHRGDPTLAFDPGKARAALEQLPRVSSAEVERRLPGTITIRLVERAPMAIWQRGGKMVLIDRDGIVLGSNEISDYAALPMVVGEDAAHGASTVLDDVAAFPALAKRVSAYIRVGDRRWDLRLNNNIEIKLPESGEEAALRQVDDAETKSGLLERDIVSVDMRLSGKMVVETAQLRDPKRKTPQQQGI